MEVIVRDVAEDDFPALFAILEEVAAERIWIGTELPLDRDGRYQRWRGLTGDPLALMLAAEVDSEVVGWLSLVPRGAAWLGMTIAAPWRDRGIGKALLERAIAWAKDVGHYKISLEVWPHNTGARALYNTFGFDEEGYLRKQWRRANGELWDSVIMGLVLEGDH